MAPPPVKLSSVIAAIAALWLLALAGPAAAQNECSLTVEPSTAPAGTDFKLRGGGFTPTQLILHKQGGQPVTIELDLGDQDPFEIPIGSEKGDEGVWRATAKLPGTCSPSVVFTATLENTDTISDLLAAPAHAGRSPLLLYLLVIGVGFAGGAIVARRLLSA